MTGLELVVSGTVRYGTYCRYQGDNLLYQPTYQPSHLPVPVPVLPIPSASNPSPVFSTNIGAVPGVCRRRE